MQSLSILGHHSNTEWEQDQAFIDYLDELDGPISKDELVEWSNDIDLFMEGLSNPDKLEGLWEQSKAKKLWDESQSKSPTQLDQYLLESYPTNDSVPIKDYMGQWCNFINQPALDIQTPRSPTPVVVPRTP